MIANIYIMLLCVTREYLYMVIVCHCSVAQACPTVWLRGLQHTRPPCHSPSPSVCPSSLVMPSSRLILWWLFSFCPQSFPVSGTFPESQLFASGDQNTGASASASVFPMSIQVWFPLQLTGLISLLSNGFSGVFPSTIVWRCWFFGTLPFLYSSSQNCMWTLGIP